MISSSTDTCIDPIGTETFESFGFSNEEELDIALLPLMQEASDQYSD